MNRFLIISYLLITSLILAQLDRDSIYSDFNNYNLIPLNSIQTDWSIINSPLLFNPINTLQSSSNGSSSLYSLYPDSQINSGLNIELQPDIILNQFRISKNWDSQKKYGVFAKYLGIAQFMGAIGLAAVHIANYNPPPKGKVNLKNDIIKKPK